VGIIDQCYVTPSYQRQGIGKKLVMRAMEWFQWKQSTRIELSLIAKNEGGDAFWRKLGFELFRHALFKDV
jgi:GNAT superfamily N-acetyltransferase